MKVARFDEERVGIVDGDQVHDVSALIQLVPGAGDAMIRALPHLRALPEQAWRSAPAHSLDQVRLLSPVLHPTKIVAAPVNYRAHVAEANADPGIRYGHTQTDIGQAGLFLKANSSVAGAGQAIPLRFPERRTDYELELVVVIGTGGSDIRAEDALARVAGYSIGLDMTLRGPEDRSFRKSIDGYSVIGPFMVTADEVPDPDSLALHLDHNGERRQQGNTRDMVYGVARLIEFASAFYTLHPGDLLFTGTPEGVGQVQPGDRLTGEIAQLGRLSVEVGLHHPGAH